MAPMKIAAARDTTLDLNWISCRADRYLTGPMRDFRGKQFISVFLDAVLVDSCSPSVREAFLQAIREYVAEHPNGKAGA